MWISVILSISVFLDVTEKLADGRGVLNSVEEYNVETNSWSERAPIKHGRVRSYAFVLPDNKVLVMGGAGFGDIGQSCAVSEVEEYDPSLNEWEIVQRIFPDNLCDFHPYFARLSDLNFIALNTQSFETLIYHADSNTVEKGPKIELGEKDYVTDFIGTGDGHVVAFTNRGLFTYSPKEKTWREEKVSGRYGVATLSHKVMAWNQARGSILFDPATRVSERLAVAPADLNLLMSIPLNEREILFYGQPYGKESSFIYDLARDEWKEAPAMPDSNWYSPATQLHNGNPMVVGGWGAWRDGRAGVLKSCFIFDRDNQSWTTASPLLNARTGASLVRLKNGNILAISGENWKD